VTDVAAQTPGPAGQAVARARDIGFRVQRRLTKRFSDVELSQLKSLRTAYADKDGPELLIFGDSNMLWTNWGEADRRQLVHIIRDELGGVRYEALVGGGYNPRIVMAFLGALQKCAGRPKVVVVPTSVLMATPTWLNHPQLGYEFRAPALIEVIERGDKKPRRLPLPDDAAWETYDRLPIPSLIGPPRTCGELRLITMATPASRWQHLVRVRHMLDYYNAERLEPDGPGVVLVGEMGTMLKEMGLPSVAHLSPINHEMAVKLMGQKVHEHIAHNAQVVETAYQNAVGDMGAVVNAVFDSPSSEFSDPAHVNQAGRRRLGAAIADAARPFLNGSTAS
jgi:hypothetical protein